MSGPFSVDDFDELMVLVADALRSGVDRDWVVSAGTVEWSCWTTLDHTIDCVFSYVLFLTSRRQDSYPPFGELHALAEATPADLVEGLEAVGRMLSAAIRAAAPDTRAVILRWPTIETGSPADFAARGALEMVLHTYDICAGLGVAFDPPHDVCARLFEHTDGWPAQRPSASSADSWTRLLQRSGRSGQ